MYGINISRATAPGAAAGRAGDARAASARFLRVRGITGNANTSMFGAARSHTHLTSRCRASPRRSGLIDHEGRDAGSWAGRTQNHGKSCPSMIFDRKHIFENYSGSAGRRRPALASEGSTTTCGVGARPRDIKYRRVSIPSDATGPQEPRGGHAGVAGGRRRRAAAAPGAVARGMTDHIKNSPLKKRRAYIIDITGFFKIT